MAITVFFSSASLSTGESCLSQQSVWMIPKPKADRRFLSDSHCYPALLHSSPRLSVSHQHLSVADSMVEPEQTASSDPGAGALVAALLTQ